MHPFPAYPARGKERESGTRRLAALTVGHATVERLSVAISEFFRTLPRWTGCWGWTSWGSSSWPWIALPSRCGWCRASLLNSKATSDEADKAYVPCLRIALAPIVF